jgi:PAS domain S-box-containing protein
MFEPQKMLPSDAVLRNVSLKSSRASPIAISISTASDGRYVEVNDAFEALFGFSREEVIGKTSVGSIS